jgi:acyl carrier protein
MEQESLAKISRFQINPDGVLLLISAKDNLPFLEIDAEGVSFDDGPFTGFFCDLEGISRFTIKRETVTECHLQIKFAEGDIYRIGRFDFDEAQHRKELHWVVTANKRISMKRADIEKHPIVLSAEVISMIASHLYVEEEQIKPKTSFRDELALESLELTELIMEAEEHFSVEITEQDVARIQTVEDAIYYINAQIEEDNI